MRSVLADLALESEAATVLGLRLAASVDAGDTTFGRLAVALGKYWVCKRTAPMVAEALECLGGNGYVEENGLARLYREAPLNSIWEGSGNVNALDVLRALSREPASVEAVLDEIRLAEGADAAFDRAVKELEATLPTGEPRRAAGRCPLDGRAARRRAAGLAAAAALAAGRERRVRAHPRAR